MKRIVSVWLPAWPVARLKRTEPKAVPADKPFALVESGAHGLLISAVNTAAAQAGIQAGARLTDARAMLPSLICRAAEPEEDKRALLRLTRWAGRYGPNRNTEGDDGFWVDVTGVAHLFGGEEKLLDDLVQRLSRFGVPSRAALAATFGAAHALARFGVPGTWAWALAPEGTDRDVLASLPVESLRLDEKTVVLLRRLGLRRAGQLYDIPRNSLARRFRSKDAAGEVLRRLDQALGLAEEPQVPLVELPALSVRRAFAEPLISADVIETTVAVICDELCEALAEKGLGARAVRLSLYRSDGTVAETHVRMRSPTRECAHILLLLKEKFVSIDAGFGIDYIVADASRVGRIKQNQHGFSDEGASGFCHPALLIDRLSNRLGAEAVAVLEMRASHIPERSEVRVPAMVALAPPPLWGRPGGGQSQISPSQNPPTPSPSPQGGGEGTYTPPWPYGKGSCRPPFMFERPEPVSVVAEIPDGPPARFTWRRLERRVVRAEGPERIAPEWWRAIGLPEGKKRPRPRDYYRIEDESGARYWVFRHGLYGGAEESSEEDDPPRWFMHGLFA